MLQVTDRFSGIDHHPHWNRLASGCARVDEQYGLKLSLQNAPADSLSVAQLDDYINRPRVEYPWQAPTLLRLRARVSHPPESLLGTAGFGFWNNMAPLWQTRMEVYPNWIWFYYASAQSTISLSGGTPSGWKASIVNGGKGGEKAMAWSDAMLRIPLLGRAMNRVRMPAREAALPDVDFTTWHDFEIHWLRESIHFRVDGQEVLQVRIKLDVPLAFVAWVDNNYASVKPTGEFDLGNLAVPFEEWLAIDSLELVRE